MSSDRCPAKRSRANAESTSNLNGASSSQNSKRDDDFWFEDGNVVLVARDVGFRIYRGLLPTQSSVFADMFASSSPSNTELYDGCPIIHPSDPADDFRDFLRVLIPSSKGL
ncbi:hypothetical protein C8Q80DRAFT_905340 [Daedaleopsis nitida]|nr:hypothetical protein C8Q80DRAFT_905340 [Daedaleopsis nitida]